MTSFSSFSAFFAACTGLSSMKIEVPKSPQVDSFWTGDLAFAAPPNPTTATVVAARNRVQRFMMILLSNRVISLQYITGEQRNAKRHLPDVTGAIQWGKQCED